MSKVQAIKFLLKTPRRVIRAGKFLGRRVIRGKKPISYDPSLSKELSLNQAVKEIPDDIFKELMA